MKSKFVFFFFLIYIQISAQYSVNTIAGSDSGYTNGAFDTALFNKPFGICLDNEGNIFIADAGNNCIRKMNRDGTVSLVAGSTEAGFEDGDVTEAKFNSPTGLCFDKSGNLFVVDFLNQAIRKIDTKGNVTTLAGNKTTGYKNGNGAEAEFNYPRGIVINSKGEIFVSDSWNHRLRKITIDGTVTTFAGGGKVTNIEQEEENQSSLMDGSDTTARLGTICGLSIDKEDNIYIADASNHTIRKVTPSGFVTTIAGNGEIGLTDGNALTANLNTPTELYIAENGELFISDTYNNAVRKLTSDGKLITLAGNGEKGFKDGKAEIVLMDYPRGIVYRKSSEEIIFVDHNNSRIRSIK